MTCGGSRGSTSPATRAPASAASSVRTRRNSFVGTVNKSMGDHSLRRGFEYRRYARDVRVLRQRSDRPVRLRLELDARSARQFGDVAGIARAVVRRVPARPADIGTDRAAARLRRSVDDLGLLRPGRLACRSEADREPRAALRDRVGAARSRPTRACAASTPRPRSRWKRRRAPRSTRTRRPASRSISSTSAAGSRSPV